MQSYPNFSTPTPGTMRGPDDSPDNLIKDRVKIAEAKAAVRTLTTHVNGLDEFAVNMYQNADSAIYDVRGEITKMHHGISNLHTLFDQLNERVTKLESVNEEKGAWCALWLGCTPHRTRIHTHTAGQLPGNNIVSGPAPTVRWIVAGGLECRTCLLRLCGRRH